MRPSQTPTAIEQRHAPAHAAHDTEDDLLGALRAHGEVIPSYPDSPEAVYSRTQILAIVNRVVPADELRRTRPWSCAAGDPGATVRLPWWGRESRGTRGADGDRTPLDHGAADTCIAAATGSVRELPAGLARNGKGQGC